MDSPERHGSHENDIALVGLTYRGPLNFQTNENTKAQNPTKQ
jgi:hypothetical protein